MIELTPADRLKVYLILHYPRVKMKHVRLSDVPGFLEAAPLGRIDIRGAGYGQGNPPMRLWYELHTHFTEHVEVLKRKHGMPTLIVWNGLVYHLDQNKSYNRGIVVEERRPHRIRQRQGNRRTTSITNY